MTWPSPAFAQVASQELAWLPHLGMGYLEVRGEHYDEAYIDHYRQIGDTPTGVALNRFRSEIVRAHCSGRTLIDVGIGDGAFLRMMLQHKGNMILCGYDVAPPAVRWLKDQNLWAELYTGLFAYATFWDSLEHIRDPRPALAHVTKKAVISLPIFRDGDHARNSKHFKRAEHYWYFSRQGFSDFVMREGFLVDFWCQTESELGREDIETFVIRRV